MPTRAAAIFLLLGLLSTPAASALAAAVPVAKPPAAYGDYLSGVVAGALGDNDTASHRLLEVLRLDPDASSVRAQAFLFSALAGKPQAAALAAQVSGNPLASLVLGNEAVRQGDWPGAQRHYNDASQSPLNGLLRPLLVAWSQQGAGETDQALETLTPLIANSPIAGVYALHAAMIADQAERSAAAARFYKQALALYPGSDLTFVQCYGSFLDRSGHSPQAAMLVHALAETLPILSMSEPALVSALGTMPVQVPRQGLARAYLNFASLITQQGGRGREAEAFMLRFALDLEPALSPARLLLADLQNAAGSPRQALASLRLIPSSDPLAPVAALRIAVIANATGDHAQAIATLERLVKSQPTHAEPLQALGDLFQDDGRPGEAIDAYDQAIRLMSPIGGDDWPVLFARATAYDRNQQWPQAQADLEHALRLAPNQPVLLNYLGYSWIERKQDLGRARIMIQRALDQDPSDGSIRDSLGWAMVRQNDTAGAVRELEKAAEQMPEDATVNYHLGVAYWVSGHRIEAQDQWRWALGLHPGKRDAARIEAALHSSMNPDPNPVAAADALPLPHP